MESKSSSFIIKEVPFNRPILNGIPVLILHLLILASCVTALVLFAETLPWVIAVACSVLFLWTVTLFGYGLIMPNKSLVITYFGRYVGTCRKNGFFWMNPFYGKRKMSLRARNMNVEPIKVNDKRGNPIMIGTVLVWRIVDTYRACFDIDSDQQVVSLDSKKNDEHTPLSSLQRYDNFVKTQSDAALRKIAGIYPYDHVDQNEDMETTLRSGSEEVAQRLEEELRDRLAIAGIEIIEARINYLAYASEIASVMLRRQQAEAIISARVKIVDGAVSMVQMALDKLEQEHVVSLDNEKKAAMVSNLLVVLCADESAQPVINAGSLY